MPREDWLILGISGATCSGKSSVAKQIHSLFTNSVLLHQDDYFHDAASDKHTRIPELNHINFEILSSLDMEAFKNRIHMVLQSGDGEHDAEGRRVDLESRFRETYQSGEIVPANECLLGKIQNLKYVPNILILEGFLLYNDEDIHNLCDIKTYFTLDRATCWERRKTRVYDPPDVPGYFDEYVWPTYITHYDEVLRKGVNVKFIDGADSIDNNFRCVLHKVLTFLS